MYFYVTERPRSKGKYLEHTTPSDFKKDFPGIDVSIMIIVGDRSVDGRFLIEVWIDDGYTQQEKDNYKATILKYFDWDAEWNINSAKTFADSMTSVTWTINGDRLEPPVL